MQHEILVDQFERYLAGEASQEFHAHLAACPACRTEVAAMENVADLFKGAFRAGLQEQAESRAADCNNQFAQPPLGFYNRVSSTIIEKQQSQAWGLFSPGLVFFRRVAFASLLLLAGLGSFLVTREASEGGADAASIIAQHDTSVVNADGLHANDLHNESSDRDRLLVTLANYRE